MTKKQSIANSPLGDRAGRSIRPNNLFGKVLLLIGDDIPTLQTLVRLIAKKGANIVLVCKTVPRNILLSLNESVQSVGQEILVIDETLLLEENNSKSQASEQLISIILGRFGNLDAFIDLSSSIESSWHDNDVDPTVTSPGSSWFMQKALLNQL